MRRKSGDEDKERPRQTRNWALFACLAGFALLVYAITIVKIKLGYGP